MKTSLLRRFLIATIALGTYTTVGLAQAFPTFPSETVNNFGTEYGVGMAQVPNTVYGTALLMARPDLNASGSLAAAFSPDGQNFSSLGLVTTPGVNFYSVNCSASP